MSNGFCLYLRSVETTMKDEDTFATITSEWSAKEQFIVLACEICRCEFTICCIHYSKVLAVNNSW